MGKEQINNKKNELTPRKKEIIITIIVILVAVIIGVFLGKLLFESLYGSV